MRDLPALKYVEYLWTIDIRLFRCVLASNISMASYKKGYGMEEPYAGC